MHKYKENKKIDDRQKVHSVNTTVASGGACGSDVIAFLYLRSDCFDPRDRCFFTSAVTHHNLWVLILCLNKIYQAVLQYVTLFSLKCLMNGVLSCDRPRVCMWNFANRCTETSGVLLKMCSSLWVVVYNHTSVSDSVLMVWESINFGKRACFSPLWWITG